MRATRHWSDELRAMARQWPTTARGKLICPECGRGGYWGGSWIFRHLPLAEAHVDAPCGRRTTVLGTHMAHCKACRAGVTRT